MSTEVAMKVLTKHTDYAIRALIALAENRGDYHSSREISEVQSIPYQFLRRILQKLAREGIVESKEGAGGGVKLAVHPSRIRVVDIIKIFQGDIELSACMFRDTICENRRTCVLRKEIKRIEKMVTREFAKLTIQKLVERSKSGE
jgi:Rrf2 family protein